MNSDLHNTEIPWEEILQTRYHFGDLLSMSGSSLVVLTVNQCLYLYPFFSVYFKPIHTYLLSYENQSINLSRHREDEYRFWAQQSHS